MKAEYRPAVEPSSEAAHTEERSAQQSAARAHKTLAAQRARPDPRGGRVASPSCSHAEPPYVDQGPGGDVGGATGRAPLLIEMWAHRPMRTMTPSRFEAGPLGRAWLEYYGARAL